MGTLIEPAHQPYIGHQTKISCAIAPIKPVAQTVTVGATEAAKAATSITVTALTEPVYKDNYLLFSDADGLEYLAKVTADAEDGATTLTVAALAEAIPAGATASWPPELLDRSAADVNRSYSSQEIMTLNTAGNRTIVTINSSKGVSAPGFYYYKNAGYKTATVAAENKVSVWVFVEYEPPSEAFSKGEMVIGKAVITERPTTSPADNFINGDLTFEFSGSVEEIDAVPTA